jgi:hypothetical protein
MGSIQQLPSPDLIARVFPLVNLDNLSPTAKAALDNSRGWSPPLDGLSVRYTGLNPQGHRSYQVQVSTTKKSLRVSADSAADAFEQARNLVKTQGTSGRTSAQGKRVGPSTAPANRSSWSDTRASGEKVNIAAKSSFLGTSPGLPPSKPPATQPAVTTTPTTTPIAVSSNAPAAKGPLETRLKQQMERIAQKGGARSVKELVTVPELSPLYNDKSAALWKTMNQSAYNSSGGRYGVSAEGQSGSKGSLVNLYGADNLVARSKKFDAAGIGAYSLLGACAGWNLNGIAGMTFAQRIVQAPLGIVRDVANLGADKIDTSGVGNVWLEAGIKGAGGAFITVLTNAAAGKFGRVLAPGKESWAPSAPMKKGMVAASFTVNMSLTALREMEKMGWLGGKLPDNPTGLQKLTDDIKKGAAIGTGVFVALGPVVWKATGGSKLKTAMTFGLPFVQSIVGGKITGGSGDQAVARGASGNLVGDGGSPKVKALNLADALRNGANPFQLADTNRSPAGKYRHFDEPALELATAVLELQDATRPTSTTPNVRTNDEAAAVIKQAVKLDKAGALKEPVKKQLRALLSDLRANDVYFGSTEVKTAVNAAFASKNTSVPPVIGMRRPYVRQVFDGSFRQDNIKKTDLGSMAVDLGMAAGSFLAPKLFLPAGVFAEVLKPTSVANDYINPATFPGFADRINAKYGNVYKALGEPAPAGRKLSATQQQAAETVLMKSLYKSVGQVVRSRAGSKTQHGTNNVPPLYGSNGGYFFTAFERMTPAEKTAVRLQVKKDIREFSTPPGNTKKKR